MPRRPSRNRSGWSEVRRLVGSLIDSPRRFWGLCAAGVVSAGVEAVLLIAVVQVAFTLAEGGTVGVEIPGTDDELGVGVILAGTLALTAAKVGAGVAGARLTAQQSTETIVSLRRDLYAAFVRATWSRQAVEKVGTLQEMLGEHARQASGLVLVGAVAVFSTVNVLVLAVIALIVQPLAALLILVTIVVLYYLLRPLSGMAFAAAERSSDAGQAYANTTIELTAMAEEVTTFDVADQAEAMVDDRLEEAAAPHYRAQLMARLMPELYVSGSLLVIVLGLAIVAAFDGARVEALGVVVILLVRALTRAQNAQNAAHLINEFLPYAQRVLDHRDDLVASRAPRGTEPATEVLPLELTDVRYDYGVGEVLRDVSLRLDPGEALGIVGPSGSGKSTLLEIVLRLRAPTTGSFTVNGVPASDIRLDEYTRRVAFVPQSPRLLTATAADNIRFLRPDIGDDAVRAAARLAHIDEEIEALENGWDTLIGERGRSLSGGQRQRLCLARALVGRPDLLVLDEPTSALDGRSEELFCESLRDLSGQVGVLIVAHRPSTLELCDRVIRLVDGRAELVVPADTDFGAELSSEGQASAGERPDGLAVPGPPDESATRPPR